MVFYQTPKKRRKHNYCGKPGVALLETAEDYTLTFSPTPQIVNPKGEMKGSAITGPVGKEAAELWPVSDMVGPSLARNLMANFLSSVLPATPVL